MNDTINCGTCYVQKMGRISIQAECTANGIGVGDYVEVWIKPTKTEA